MPGKAVLTNDPFAKLSDDLDARQEGAPARISWLFVGFMAALTALFIFLGMWQVQRLAQKQGLISAVEERASLPYVQLPAVAEWGAIDPETYNFRPVTFTGHFAGANTVYVFTALPNAKGEYKGVGYWVMVPFVSDAGGTIIVNRGFIPQSVKDLLDGGNQITPLPVGSVQLEGLARASEKPNGFTPGPDLGARIEYVRSIARMSEMMDTELAPFAGFYVDVKVGNAGELPQGGETVMRFSNRHLEYIFTWFGLAVVTPLLTMVWLWQQRRR